jgi:hypothetical protein
MSHTTALHLHMAVIAYKETKESVCDCPNSCCVQLGTPAAAGERSAGAPRVLAAPRVLLLSARLPGNLVMQRVHFQLLATVQSFKDRVSVIL